MAKKKAEETEKKVTGKKAGEKKVTEKKKVDGKKEKITTGKRGRIAGVRNQVKDEYTCNIKEQEEIVEEAYNDLNRNLFKFFDGGNKVAAGKARANLMCIIKTCKDMRKEIQNAKNDMDQVPIDKK